MIEQPGAINWDGHVEISRSETDVDWGWRGRGPYPLWKCLFASGRATAMPTGTHFSPVYGFSDRPHILYCFQSILPWSNSGTQKILTPIIDCAALDIQVKYRKTRVYLLRRDYSEGRKCLASVLSLRCERVASQPRTLTEPPVMGSLFHNLIKGIGVCVHVWVRGNNSPPLCYNKSRAEQSREAKASSAACARIKKTKKQTPWRVSSLHVQRTSCKVIKQTGTCCAFVLPHPSGEHTRWEEHPRIGGLILLCLSTMQRA